MKCSQCGEENPARAVYCMRCGHRMAPESRQGVRADGGVGAGPPSDRSAYGGFWRRVAATLIDSLLIGVPQVMAQLLISPQTMAPNPEPVLTTADIVWMLINIVVAWLYWAGMHSSRYRATVGKMALGLRVVDYYGERISFLRATGRHFAEFLSALAFGIGYLLVVFTRRRQALHDLMAETLVVRKEVLAG
ncbi:MAG: RDD family protein [Pseudomonadota bacterium]